MKKIISLLQEDQDRIFFNIKKLSEEYKDYAEKNGFHLNSDKKIVEHLIKALIRREEKYGGRYCPCRRVTGNKKTDKKNICPCVFHKEEIKKQGHCRCFLFVK